MDLSILLNGFIYRGSIIRLTTKPLIRLFPFGIQYEYRDRDLHSLGFHEINSAQLLGLVYNHKSEEVYNKKAFELALQQLWHSWQFHPSPRFTELAGIILNGGLQEAGIIMWKKPTPFL